ncbi:MAG: hypothetical protein WCI47_01805 [bacterium]
MLSDYSTFLMKSQLKGMSDRKALKAMRALDRWLILVFDVSDRAMIQRFLPGYRQRTFGARFGVTPSALSVRPSVSWDEAKQEIMHSLRIKDEAIFADLVDTYLRVHLSVMPVSSRLQFAQACPDDLLRAYLRVVQE